MRATEIVRSYLDAWNHRDPKGIADHLSSDGIYCDVPENLQVSPDQLIVSLNDFFAKYRHHYALTGQVLKGKNSIGFQYRMFPFGNNQKNGRTVTYHGSEFMTLHGDAVKVITDYYDIPVKTQTNKYAKSGLSKDHLRKYMQRLERIMQTREEYLRPDLTLPKLAQVVGCSVNHLSQVINAGFGTSFLDYLNRYRIEHAKQLLAETGGQNIAVLHIAFKVGFNSNSAFYAAFKKHVGMTPAQYRQAN